MAKRNMFVGMDVHKESIDISIAEEGCGGEVRHYGVIAGDLEEQPWPRHRRGVRTSSRREHRRRPPGRRPSPGRAAGRPAPRPEPEQGLKRGHRRFAPVMAKDEFVEIDLQVMTADAVVGADEPLLQVADGAGTTDGAPLRRALLSGCVRGTCLTLAACKSSKPFRPSV